MDDFLKKNIGRSSAAQLRRKNLCTRKLAKQDAKQVTQGAN
jgi:hypothetical protein